MKEVALITLHGMGDDKTGYYKDLEKGLKRALREDWEKVSFQNVLYSPEFQIPQNELWKKMNEAPGNDLDATKLRRFFLSYFGDAVSLEHAGNRQNSTYEKIQKEIQAVLERAFFELGQDPQKPVVIIAQSLGGQVISNFLWDAEHDLNLFSALGKEGALERFTRLHSLQSLYTTGCNMPLFNSGFSKRLCFKHPNPDFQWDNFYDPDDVLGWPLAQLGEGFEFIRDHAINAGGFFTSWNPACHKQYWKDRDVIQPLARRLKELLDQ